MLLTSALPGRLGLFLATVCSLCLPAGRLPAQSAQTIKAFAEEPHTGPVEEALVGLQAVIAFRDGTHQTRHANGLMLRCDGFVLAPTSLFFANDPKNPTIDHVIAAFLHPGTEREKRVRGRLPAIFGVSPLNKSERLKLGYAVLKLDEVHVPALRTLLPAVVNPGDEAQVAWSAWDAAHNRFLPAQRRAVLLGENLADKKKLAQGRAVFHDTTAEVPAGATVLGPEDKAIGLTGEASASEQKEFITFAMVGYATNCISPQTVTDALFPKVLLDRDQRRLRLEAEIQGHGGFGKQLPPKVTSVGGAGESSPGTFKPEPGMVASAPDMVYVPGGPVRMPPGVLQFQSDMQGASTACVAPFLIDKYEVTNRQYYAFWKSLPESVRQDKDKRFFYYPIGWANSDPPFPADLANVPVLGVRAAGAFAYASWTGKRLPTPYEWCLAAFGPKGETEKPKWVKDYIADRQRIANGIIQAHVAFLREYGLVYHPGNSPSPTFQASGGHWTLADSPIRIVAEELFKLPWVFTKVEVAEQAPAANPDLRTGRIGRMRRRGSPPGDPVPLPDVGLYDDPITVFKLDFARTLDTFSKHVFDPAMDEISKTWVDPIYVLPVGSRPFDTSPYGAMDMILNAQELVMPGPAFPYSQYYRESTDFIPYEFYVSVDWKLGDWDDESVSNEPPKYNRASTPFYIDVAPFAMNSRNSWYPREKTFSRRIRSAYDNITNLDEDFVYPNYGWALRVESTVAELAHSTCWISDWKTHMAQGPVYQFGPGYWAESPILNISGIYRVARDADDPAVAPYFLLLDELWGRDGPLHGHQELARRAMDGVYIPPQLRPGAQDRGPRAIRSPVDTYVLPGGFRCAR